MTITSPDACGASDGSTDRRRGASRRSPESVRSPPLVECLFHFVLRAHLPWCRPSAISQSGAGCACPRYGAPENGSSMNGTWHRKSPGYPNLAPSSLASGKSRRGERPAHRAGRAPVGIHTKSRGNPPRRWPPERPHGQNLVHHSGSGWLARPSPWGTCTSYSLPAFLAHSAQGHERRFRDVGEPVRSTSDSRRLQHRSEPTLRATKRHSLVAGPNGTIEGTGLYRAARPGYPFVVPLVACADP